MGVVYACAFSFISKYLYQSCGPKPMTRVDINDNNQSSNNEKVEAEASNTILLMSGKELLEEFKKEEEMQFVVVRKPIVILTSTSIDNLLEEIQELLENFADIVVDDLPC
jgi:CBS domain containing-hemolysin-like protein